MTGGNRTFYYNNVVSSLYNDLVVMNRNHETTKKLASQIVGEDGSFYIELIILNLTNYYFYEVSYVFI